MSNGFTSLSNPTTVTLNGFPDASGNGQGNQQAFHQQLLPAQNDMPSNFFGSGQLSPHSTASTSSASLSDVVQSELSPLQQVMPSSATTIVPGTPGLLPQLAEPISALPESQPQVQGDAKQWFVQWHDFDKEKEWNITIPKHKFCKKRSFHAKWDDIFYKAPYKYHVKVDIEGRGVDSNKLVAQSELRFENGEQVTSTSKSKKPIIKNSEGKFSQMAQNKVECVLNGLQFNICSYKADNRQFRFLQTIFERVPMLQSSLVGQQKNQLRPIVSLVSPVFTIRAKKPVSKPGIKKRKRQSNLHPKEPSLKRAKIDSIPQLMDNFSILPEEKQRYILDQLVERASPVIKDYLRVKHFQVAMPMMTDFGGVFGIQSCSTSDLNCLESLFQTSTADICK